MKKDITKEYITYLSPEFLYVPFDNIEKLKINKDKKVYNNTCLGENNDNTKIFSPVSGEVKGIVDMNYTSGLSKSLMIENDFIDKREKLNYTKNINKIKKSDIVSTLEKYNLNKKINSKTILVVNSYFNKDNDLKDMVINHESYEEILEAIDEFMDIFNMKTCYICIDKDDLYSNEAYNKYINAFLNICVVNSNKKFKDSTCVFYTIEEILAIHKAIHLDYLYDNTIVTICEKDTTIVKVKIYTSLYELLKALKITTKGKEVYVNNNLIENIKTFVIDPSVRSIIVK